MGTCAGCVLLAKEGDTEVERTGTRLLGLMDMAVDRNAFGRQRESFEAPLDLKGMSAPFPGVFIRGPVIRRSGAVAGAGLAMATSIVMARQEQPAGPELPSRAVRGHPGPRDAASIWSELRL